MFLLILCSIKIERLLFLKFVKILAFFDSYFWPFNKAHEKIVAIFVSVQSWLQSEMFLSNSVDVMKNLPMVSLNSIYMKTHIHGFHTLSCIIWLWGQIPSLWKNWQRWRPQPLGSTRRLWNYQRWLKIKSKIIRLLSKL